MDRQGSGSSSGLSHRKLRSQLRSFRPAEAAFVLHLATCERCRILATGLLSEGEAEGGDFLSNSPLDRIVADLARGSLLLGSMADRTKDDLPPLELQAFLDSLTAGDKVLIRHLLTCTACQKAAARSLAPKDSSAYHPIPASIREVIV